MMRPESSCVILAQWAAPPHHHFSHATALCSDSSVDHCDPCPSEVLALLSKDYSNIVDNDSIGIVVHNMLVSKGEFALYTVLAPITSVLYW